MPGKGTTIKSSVDVKKQTIGKLGFSLTEPNPARFGRIETKAVQRPKIGAAAVSEVRSASANPFENTRNVNAHHPRWRVCNETLAEGEGLRSNLLWATDMLSKS
jgi:hypothetical protein